MVGVAPAANAPADFDPLDMRHVLGGSEDADTAHSVPPEMQKALANLAPSVPSAGEPGPPMTMRMSVTPEVPNEAPTRIVPPLATDLQNTVLQPELDSTMGGDGVSPVPMFEGGPPAPSSLARAAQTSFDRKPLERKPLVTTVAMMGPITKIPLPSSRGSNLPVRASRMPSQSPASPSNSPPRVLSPEQADMPAPSDGATMMVSPERELERGPDTAPPPVAKHAEPPPAPPPPPAKFDGTLESASEERHQEESTMMVLPEEIIEEPSIVSIAAPSQPSDGGTMMIAAVKHAPSLIPAAPPTPPPPLPAEPEMPKTQPPRIASNLKTSIGIAPPVFSNPPPMPAAPPQAPRAGMISPTPIVSIAPAPPPPQQISITPAIPPAGAPPPQLSALPVRPTVQLPHAGHSMPPPVPPMIPQTPVMPPAMRASYAQLPPHQWPADQNMSLPPAMPPQASLAPMSDASRPLTYSVFDPAELANVAVRSPSMPSRASFGEQKPGMTAGMKVGLAVLAVCLVAGTAGAIVLGTSDDSPGAKPATSASVTSAASIAPIPIPTPIPPPTEIPSAVPDPPPTAISDPPPPPVPTTTGKKKKKDPPPSGAVPPNPFASGMPGKRK